MMSASPGKLGLLYSDYTHATIYAHCLESMGWTVWGASETSNVWSKSELEALKEPFPQIRFFADSDEMFRECDALVCCNADYRLNVELARKAMEYKKPLFLDKPACGTVSDVEELRSMIASGARLFLGSSFPYSPSTTHVLRRMVNNGFHSLHFYGAQEFFEHGIHCAEVAGQLLGCPPVSAEAVQLSDAILVQALYENGAQVKYFLEGPGANFAIVYANAHGWGGLTLDNSMHSKCHFMLKARAFDAMARGESADLTSSYHLDGILLLIAAKKSLEGDGEEVRIADLEATDGYDSRFYAKQYTAKRRTWPLVSHTEKDQLLRVLEPPPPSLSRRITRKLFSIVRRLPAAVWWRLQSRVEEWKKRRLFKGV